MLKSVILGLFGSILTMSCIVVPVNLVVYSLHQCAYGGILLVAEGLARRALIINDLCLTRHLDSAKMLVLIRIYLLACLLTDHFQHV